MKFNFLLSLFLLSLLPGCINSKINTEPESKLINFSDSVAIVRTLLETKSIHKILEEADPEKINFLINNFSPAEIALEAEVLHCTLPVLIYLYDKEIDHQSILESLALKYENRLKVVLIDVDKFSIIAEIHEIDKYPVIFLINNRQEQWRSDAISLEAIEHAVTPLFAESSDSNESKFLED